jgi:hypothetical protein
MKKETLSTSDKEVPKINLGLEQKYKEENKKEFIQSKEPLNPENISESLVDSLPNPTGWRFIIYKHRRNYARR